MCEQEQQEPGQQLSESTRMHLYSAIANLLGDVEEHPRLTLLRINQTVVDIMVKYLDRALRNEFGGQPWEAMQALANLATADENKALICECCLGLAMGVLTQGSSGQQLEQYTCKLLARLALHQDNLPLLQARRVPLLALFQRLETHGQLESTRRVAAVGRFQLAGTTVSKEEHDMMKDNMQKGHIMLS